jgi:hypothetical protein
VINELRNYKKKGIFDLHQFSRFARTHQQMLFPAFQMQLKLQDKVMGRKFWEKCTNKRVEWTHGHFMSMADLMEMVSLKLSIDFFSWKAYLFSHSIFGQNFLSNFKTCVHLTHNVEVLLRE